jgi:hypothetical protein
MDSRRGRTAIRTFLTGLLLAHMLGAQPVDNPVATFYGLENGYPAWTDRIAWDVVFDVTDPAYGAVPDDGLSDFDAFELARDAAAAAGGGVVYFPAGTYHFTLPDAGAGPGMGPHGRGLMLPTGVVIRGATPGGDQWARPVEAYPDDGQLDLPTKFVFEFQSRDGGELPLDWNLIGLQPDPVTGLANVGDVGICWVSLEGAVIHFGAEQDWADTLGQSGWLGYKIKDNWPGAEGSGNTWADRVPDGTHPADMLYGTAGDFGAAQFLGAGSGRLVFGVELKDATVVADWYTPVGNDHPTFGPHVEADDFHIHRWSGRIAVNGADVFIGNNALPMPTRNFVHSQHTLLYNGISDSFVDLAGRDILFDYSQVIGIDVNKNHYALCQPTEPGSGYYEPNVQVRDNYVFNRGSHGYTISGQWAVVENNYNQRFYYGTVVPAAYGIPGYAGTESVVCTKDGFGTYNAESGTDFNSRGYDFGGRNLWVGNNGVVNTGSIGNDGEAFMGQRYLGFEVYSWAFTDNRHGQENSGNGTQGETGWIGSYDMQNYGFLALRNTTPGWVGHAKAGSNNLYDFSLVVNSAGSGLKTDAGGESDVDTSDHAGNVVQPIFTVTAQPDGSRLIEWNDTAGNELGFRVARRIGGGLWHTIAYRPRQSLLGSAQGTDPWSSTPVSGLNPPSWRDYTIPAAAGSVEYAVIAIDAIDLVPVEVEPLQIDSTLQVWFETQQGLNYQLYESTDLDNWSPAGPPGAGTGAPALLHEAVVSTKAFYRVAIFRDMPES